jgi:tetratricopeptide (TPR) repeat protein
MRGRRARVLALLLLVAGATVGVARGEGPAEETEEVRRAKAYFEAGRARFRAGDYEAAARAFAEGYAVVPRSTFLLNMGLCYRRLKQLDRAEDAFRRFLEGASPDDPYRKQARELLDEIARERTGAPPPAAQASTSSPPPPVAAPASVVMPAPTAPPPVRDEARRRRLRTLAWALPVAVVVATGTVVGLVLGLRSRGPACEDERFGCLDLR